MLLSFDPEATKSTLGRPTQEHTTSEWPMRTSWHEPSDMRHTRTVLSSEPETTLRGEGWGRGKPGRQA